MNNKYIKKVEKFFHFGKRTYSDYQSFIERARTSGFKFVPLSEFIKPKAPNERIIGLRHDVDSELNLALKIAKLEHEAGVKATYFVRHTAMYFYENIAKDKINKHLFDKLRYLQNALGHEIGIHTDLMPIEIIYKKDPSTYLKYLVNILNENGINVYGIAPHGNLFRHLYQNSYIIKNKEIRNQIFADPYIEFDAKKFDVYYEAYSLLHDRYFSDAKFVNNKRWDFSNIDENLFGSTGRTIILTHPIHWAPSRMSYFTENLILTSRYLLSYMNEYSKYRRSR